MTRPMHQEGEGSAAVRGHYAGENVDAAGLDDLVWNGSDGGDIGSLKFDVKVPAHQQSCRHIK
jgi:hypothetical protein